VNWLDLFFLIILLWAVRSSWETGLIQEAFTLAGLIFGILMAGQLYRPVARILFGPAPNNLANAITFLAVLLAVWFGITFLGRLVRETVYWIMLGWLDRLGGLLFGILKGLVVIEIFLIVFARFPVLNTEELIQGSLIASRVQQYAPAIMALLPSEFRHLTRIVR
jgi:membrane protein required for colicin V production